MRVVSTDAASGVTLIEEDPMTLSTPDKSGAASLEAIARNGSLLRRIAVRIPTYLTDLRENPAWLPMFM